MTSQWLFVICVPMYLCWLLKTHEIAMKPGEFSIGLLIFFIINRLCGLHVALLTVKTATPINQICCKFTRTRYSKPYHILFIPLLVIITITIFLMVVLQCFSGFLNWKNPPHWGTSLDEAFIVKVLIWLICRSCCYAYYKR